MTLLKTAVVLLAATLPPLASAASKAIPKVGDTAADFELAGLDGTKTRLSTLAQTGPVVLVVLRGYPGYQCPVCSAQVAGLSGQADAFRSAGANVVLVYPGPADALQAKANEFVKGKALPEGFRLLLDPDYTFTTAYGLRWDAKNETAYPSTFVLDRDRTIRYAKVSKSHGGRAGASEVLSALKK